MFYDEMKSFLTDLSFHQSSHDPCLWYKSLDEDPGADTATPNPATSPELADAFHSLGIGDDDSKDWYP